MRYLKIIKGERLFATTGMAVLECAEHAKIIYNPKGVDILDCGYKPIVEAERPSFDYSVEYPEERFTETEDCFVQEWVLVLKSDFVDAE